MIVTETSDGKKESGYPERTVMIIMDTSERLFEWSSESNQIEEFDIKSIMGKVIRLHCIHPKNL
jgi:hypothetical protein